MPGNQIRRVPGEIRRLSRLQELTLRANRLESVPGFLFRLPQLRSLDISHNQLDSIEPRRHLTVQIGGRISGENMWEVFFGDDGTDDDNEFGDNNSMPELLDDSDAEGGDQGDNNHMEMLLAAMQ